MRAKILGYTIVIHKEGSQYIANVPALEISDFGSTPELAKRHVRDAIAIHVEGLSKTNTAVPSSI